MKLKVLWPFLLTTAIAIPGIALRLAGVHLDPIAAALVSGAAILSASFLLLWACDAAQADISQTLALAVVAFIAVLPEYAVDMYFTWMAGKHPDQSYAHYAVANMTGANRLLIGVAWGLIALLFWVRHRRAVQIGHERRLELLFLAAATIYAFIIPLKGSLAWYDGLVFLVIYAAYIGVASRRPSIETEAEGPAEALIRLPKAKRRLATLGLFVFAGGAILANAEPFCEGLIGTGRALHINEFLLVQWLAPIASEAPEFIVALMFAWRGHASMALGSLLSSKLNQWTLLVGMIPGVFAVSHGSLAHPMPMDDFQMREIMLTAAQSLLGVVILASLRLSLSQAMLLFGLFAGQLIMPEIVKQCPTAGCGIGAEDVHVFFSVLYIMSAVALFFNRPQDLLGLSKAFAKEPLPAPAGAVVCDVSPHCDVKTEHCHTCHWRMSGIQAAPSEVNLDEQAEKD